MTKTAADWIKELELIPHSEGGYFRQTAKSERTIDTARGKRALYTSILFLLTESSPSHHHRLASDETWYYPAEQALSVHCIFAEGSYQVIEIGSDIGKGQQLSYTVPKRTIFGSSVTKDHSLVSCVVTPGFDYHDFELFTKQNCLQLILNIERLLRN